MDQLQCKNCKYWVNLFCIGVSWNDEDQDKFGKQVKYFCIMDSFHKMFQKSIHCPENVCN